MKGNTTRADEGLAGEAAQWFTAMQGGEVSGKERAQFCEWLERSPQHVQEYLAIASLWRHLDATADAHRSAEELIALARADEGATNVVNLPFASVPLQKGQGAKLSTRRLLFAASVLLACCAAGLAAWFVAYRAAVYSTALGEQTSFVLADGSTVRLNTQSKIRVRLNEDARDISLLDGEALFEVAKDPRRPFRVHVEDTVVEAVGTVFNVYRAKNETRVTVLEGRVAVSSLPPSARSRGEGPGEVGPPIELIAGEQTTVTRSTPPKPRPANIAAATAWTARRLIFNAETLQTVVDEFNRYNVQRLQVVDPALASLRINGNFRATDPQSLVQFLERTESVDAVPADNGTLRLSRGK